jgi:hypothetical protein
MTPEIKPVRLGGKKKSPVVVKISLDEATSLRLMAMKPNSITTSGFCAMMVEYGLKAWEKVEQGLAEG